MAFRCYRVSSFRVCLFVVLVGRFVVRGMAGVAVLLRRRSLDIVVDVLAGAVVSSKKNLNRRVFLLVFLDYDNDAVKFCRLQCLVVRQSSRRLSQLEIFAPLLPPKISLLLRPREISASNLLLPGVAPAASGALLRLPPSQR